MIKLNLLPSSEKKYIQIIKIEKYILYSFLFLFFALSMASGCLIFFRYKLEQNLNLLKQQTLAERSRATNNDFKAKIEEINAKLKNFNTLKKDSSLLTPLMLEIFDLTPPELNYKKVTFDKTNEKLVLSGIAEKREKLLEFQHNLEEKENVIKINTPLSNLEKEEQGEFLIEVYLKQ